MCAWSVCIKCVWSVCVLCVVKPISSFHVIFVFEVCVWSVCIECMGRVSLVEFERRYLFLGQVCDYDMFLGVYAHVFASVCIK